MKKHILPYFYLILAGVLFGLSPSLAEHPTNSEHPSKKEHPSKSEHPAKSEHSSKKEKPAHAKAELLAVAFHADWCGSCKVLAPKMTKVSESLSSHPIQFIKMDLTNEATTAEAKKLAAELGLSEYLEANEGKTGYILLLDADNNRKIGMIEASLTVAKIEDSFKEALARAKADAGPAVKKPEHPSKSEQPKKSEHPSKSEHPR